MTDHPRSPGPEPEACAWFDESVAELALGLLDPRTSDELTAHAAGCDRCRVELDAFARAADRTADLAPELDVPPTLAERAVASMPPDARETRAADPRRRRVSRAVVATGVVLAAATLLVAALVWRSDADHVQQQPVLSAQLIGADGNRHGSAVIAPQSGRTRRPTLTLTLTGVEPSTYHCKLGAGDGRVFELASWRVEGNVANVWSVGVPASVDSPRWVAITDDEGQEVARARFG